MWASVCEVFAGARSRRKFNIPKLRPHSIVRYIGRSKSRGGGLNMPHKYWSYKFNDESRIYHHSSLAYNHEFSAIADAGRGKRFN